MPLVPHTAHRSPAGNGLVLQGPWGVRSRSWRPSRADPFSHGQLLHSRRVSEGKTWTWNDPSKQSPRWVHPQATAPVPLTPKLPCFFFFFFWPVFPNRPIHFPQQNPPPTPTLQPPPFLFPVLPSSHPPPVQNHLVNSSYSSPKEEKAFQVYRPLRCFLF